MTVFRETRPGEYMFETSPQLVPEVIDKVRPELEEAESRGFEISRVLMMLDEVVSNIYRHGYRMQNGKPVGVRLRVEGDLVQIAVRDRAPTFNSVGHAEKRALPDPRLGKPGGMGLIILQKLCEKFVHQTPSDGGNALYMSVRLRSKSDRDATRTRVPDRSR
jgi:anti-sigma regulatory factor (Ser/Thr protein kinase)